MKKIAVVYWSGTGNTKAMAEAVAAGIKQANGEASIFSADGFSSEGMAAYDGVAFGCPSMGAEQLEESEFEPMFTGCEPQLKGKKIALFGSYGWGDGEWMRNWEDTCTSGGAVLVCDSVICKETPDEAATSACNALGAALAG